MATPRLGLVVEDKPTELSYKPVTSLTHNDVTASSTLFLPFQYLLLLGTIATSLVCEAVKPLRVCPAALVPRRGGLL